LPCARRSPSFAPRCWLCAVGCAPSLVVSHAMGTYNAQPLLVNGMVSLPRVRILMYTCICACIRSGTLLGLLGLTPVCAAALSLLCGAAPRRRRRRARRCCPRRRPPRRSLTGRRRARASPGAAAAAGRARAGCVPRAAAAGPSRRSSETGDRKWQFTRRRWTSAGGAA
jgi:hypothetical protein